uniref:Uncharacterized protein n=1 Tax=Phlebotomus papatasi TaxID=29031 RepID=A0A1B0GQR4_PHLPP
MTCIARNCGNKHVDNIPGITFHRFPTNTKMTQQWVKLLGLGEYYKIKRNSDKVCSKHFRDEDFYEKTYKDNITRKYLKPNVLPQENLTLKRALESTASSGSTLKKRRRRLKKKLGDTETAYKKDHQKIKNLRKKKTEGQKVPRAYQPIIRQFCLTLDFLSPRAYKYVRQVFQNTLPNPSTLASWYRTVEADPGFTKECMDVLRKFVEKEKDQDREVHCQLLFDEIYIFSQIQKVGTKVYGYSSVSTHGRTLNELATQILQFMIVGINGSWKIPIGYFPIHSMTREAKQNIVETFSLLMTSSVVIFTPSSCFVR